MYFHSIITSFLDSAFAFSLNFAHQKFLIVFTDDIFLLKFLFRVNGEA